MFLQITASIQYLAIIRRAFPQLPTGKGTGWWTQKPHQWCLDVSALPATKRQDLVNFLNLLSQHLLLPNPLDECYALGWHSTGARQEVDGRWVTVRTPLGERVRKAKSYRPGQSTGDRLAAHQLADDLLGFVDSHPTYSRADAVLSVPASNPNKAFDLPSAIIERLCADLGKPNLNNSIRKLRATPPMKNVVNREQKFVSIAGCFQCDSAPVSGRTIIVVDDLYGSGATMSELGTCVRRAGASMVLGLTVTKNRRDR